MKTVQFTNIHLENFGKHSEAVGGKTITIKLGKNTAISGSNACGKSTIKRAIQYILGTKDENGKEISGIRPHDENGVDIDGLTTVAELAVSVDGVENTLKRNCFQEKNRQGEYTGKDNLQYFVDDVKKGTKKAYEEFVQTIVPNMVCISAQELLQKDTAGRRAMLEPFSKHTADSIIDENPDFEPIGGKLRANSVTDLKKACRDKIKATEKKRDEVVTTIKVKESEKQDIDLAELELHRNALNEQIAEVKGKQANVDKQYAEFDKQSKDILDLHFELNGLQQKADEKLEEKRRRIRIENEEILSKIDKILLKIRLLKSEISEKESTIKRNEILRKEQLELWDVANKREFDENSLVCQFCGREYEEDKKQKLREKFESGKQHEIAEIKKRGMSYASAIEKGNAEIEQLRFEVLQKESEKTELESRIAELETQYNALPQSIDISDREDVKVIKQQIAEKEQAMKKGNSAKEIREQLQVELEDLQGQLNEVEKQFDIAKKNDEIDEEISNLQQKQRDLSQEIADIEQELDLLKQFEEKKAELLESDINENLDFVKFKMSEIQQNGELKDVCQILVGGESYDRNLNFSNRLLAEIDICRMFQRLYDVQLPILLDNAESVDDERIPQVENQLILFKWTDDKELRIEVIE